MEQGADDLTEGEGYDCQIVAAQTKRGDTDDHTAKSRNHAADDQANQNVQCGVAQRRLQNCRHFTADVGTHAHKSGVS